MDSCTLWTTKYPFTKPSQRKPAGLMVPICPQRPWQYTGVDFVGPLPRTPYGNAYILVFLDYFSKWVEVRAVREATAQVATSKLLSEVFARHGMPTYLISDRGSPFVSELFNHVLTTLGSEHRLMTAYHPQTNATERVNRSLKIRPCLCRHQAHGMGSLPAPNLLCLENLDELVRVKTHPRSDALANFTAKLAPVYTGPYRVPQKLFEETYWLTDVSTEADAGVFHVANLLPFRTWDTSGEAETHACTERGMVTLPLIITALCLTSFVSVCYVTRVFYFPFCTRPFTCV
uniref:Integrase catalytic domain-containing protein n=1 Tax=Cyprinus carpio TaxID=7962 RepID=A0A8C1ZRU1_CYPCA